MTASVDIREPEVLVEHEDAVTRVTFNRPHRLNAITLELLDGAARAVTEAAGNGARVVVLTGAGRGFSSGADLAPGGAEDTPPTATVDAANRLVRAIRDAPLPVLAAVNGPAAGGSCSFAFAADLAVARESAYFYLSFARAGLMPDAGATAFVPDALGRNRASRLFLLAEQVSATRAVEWGLISHVVPDEDFDAEVDRLARHLAAGPTVAYARTKAALNRTTLPHLGDAMAAEREGQEASFYSDDFAEGLAAFRERRDPRFRGR